MAFFTELFSRPRAGEGTSYRVALTILNAMGKKDRTEIPVRPADFPRIAR